MEDMTRSYEKNNQDLLLLVAILMRRLGQEEIFIPQKEVFEALDKRYTFQAEPDYKKDGMIVRIYSAEG